MRGGGPDLLQVFTFCPNGDPFQVLHGIVPGPISIYQLGLLPTIQSNLIISLNCAYVPEVSCSRRGRRDCDSAAPRPALSAAPPGTCDAHGGDARPPPPSTSASPASPLAGSPGRKWLPGSAGVAAAGACGRAGVHSLWLCELTASHLCNCKVDR